MNTGSIGQHISQQFNVELEDIRNQVMAMGGKVEEQLAEALLALEEGDSTRARQVVKNDYLVNAMEVSIDEACGRVLARRQPAAFDLRLVVAIIKTIADLERIGDQAERIARFAAEQMEEEGSRPQFDVEHIASRVKLMLHDALDAFARMDPEAAVAVVRQDERIDHEYNLLMRQLITFMMEDPRTITRTLNMMWIARAMERIGDHAKNICEYVIYMVKGKNVRHTTLEQLEAEVKGE